MKKVSLLVFLTLCLSIYSNAQEFQTDSIAIDSMSKKIDKLQETMQKIQKIVEKDSINELIVGKFIFFENNKVPAYKKPKKKKPKEPTGDSLNIKKVIVDIRDGVIFDIQVITNDNKTFTNKRATIEVNKFTDRCDLVGFFNGTDNIYLQTCDFLRFERSGSYISKDISFTLNKKGEEKSLTKGVGVNQIFNIKLYTDLLGAIGGEKNGLIQTEVDFFTPIITTNFWNKNIYGLNYFRFNFNVSRFDDKFKYTICDSVFSRQTLFQRSWLSSEIAFNLISGLFQSKSNSRFAIDLIGGFSLSNIVSESDSSTVALPYYGIEPKINIRVSQNIGVNLSSPALWQTVPQLNEEKENKKMIIIPEIEIIWNPLKNPGSKIFGRVRYFTMEDDDNPFWQVQVGYNLSLSEIINKKIEQK